MTLRRRGLEIHIVTPEQSYMGESATNSNLEDSPSSCGHRSKSGCFSSGRGGPQKASGMHMGVLGCLSQFPGALLVFSVQVQAKPRMDLPVVHCSTKVPVGAP